VPVLLSGERVIISTGTRHLQDQLYANDLPVVLRALSTHTHLPSAKHCLLKGRANYLCRHRLIKASRSPLLRDKMNQQYLQILHDWSRSTETGDIAEVIGIPEDAMIWSHITSHAEFCAQHEADELADCFVSKARQRAQQCDIVGKKITSRRLNDLARDTVSEQIQDAPDMRELREAAERIEDAVRHFRLAFGVDPRRDAWMSLRNNTRLENELERLDRALDVVTTHLSAIEGRSKGLDGCLRRSTQLRQELSAFVKLLALQDTDSEQEPFSSDFVYWFETTTHGFSLNMTPMNVARQFRQAMESLSSTWVFTSATLAVGGDFSHFKDLLGIEQAQELLLDSPFDYRKNALLYQPDNLPEPSSPGYTETVLDRCLPVLKASRGRAFILFTSYRALRIAEKYFADQDEFNILSQGSQPKRELVEAFQSLPNAVLLGTNSFWEGVDVRGAALSCVVIDKLPFGSPGDPVMSARISRMQQAGGNPFFEFQVPQAAITLKQGVGRLIRDISDRGVFSP